MTGSRVTLYETAGTSWGWAGHFVALRNGWHLVVFVVALAMPALGQTPGGALTGFSLEGSERELSIERELAASLSAERIGEQLRELTSRPHPAGSEGARHTAEYLLAQLTGFGLDAEIVRYNAWLPLPVSVAVDLIEPSTGGEPQALPTTEARIESDPFTHDAERFPAWMGYSPSGEAEGHVVYANFGSEWDLQALAERGIDLHGKILLERHFGTGVGRKIRNAEHAGAAGVLLYADPAEDGFPYGDVYPEGNWRPWDSIMRRSLIFLPYEGDPLSPGWASVPGARRLDPAEVALPKIPAQPISYRTALHLLELVGGPLAPADWQGALPVTYRLGPGQAKVRIRTEMDFQYRPMWDVVARLEGESQPDQWVVLGNHHDAWIYGAGDPSSGTATLLELARALGEQAERGVRPARTLILAFWDAEEMLLGGSTEWVEDHQAELLERAVANLNMDSAVFNPDRPLSVASHPVLHELFRDVSRAVPDPRTGKSTFEVWRDGQNEFRKVPGVDGWGEFFDPEKPLERPYLFEAPYDDAAPFFNLLALPASDMYYGADYGMYHSLYEDFHWMSTVVDPGFAYHRVMAEIHGRAALRLANADLVPLDYAEEARFWRLAYEDLQRVAAERGQTLPLLDEALSLIDEWEAAATGLAQDAAARLVFPLPPGASATRSEQQIAEISRAIALTARDFYRPEGHPGMPFERNMFSGSLYEFADISGGSLPGLRFALDQGDLPRAASEAATYVAAIERRVAGLRAIRRDLAQIP